MEPIEAPDSSALLSPLSPGEALLNVAPHSDCEPPKSVSFANPLEQPPPSRPRTPAYSPVHSPAASGPRKRKTSSLSSSVEFLHSALKTDSESEGKLTKYLRETCASLSDCSWSSPRLGCLTDGENTPGTRSQAQSSGDEKAVASPSMVVVQRPRGILFMKDKCLPSPFIVHINLPPGVRHSGLVQAKLYTNGAKDCTVLAEVAPVLTLTSTADGVPPVLQLVATFDALRFDCTTHNQPAFLCFEMSITHERETQPRVTSTPPSDPLIVCSHSTQLISAAGQLLRMAAFGAATQLAWVRFAAVLRAHFVDCAAVVRPLSDLDIDYVHERLDRPQFVSLADCNKLWTWLGNVLKAVYGRHGHAMWENGLLVGLAPPDRTARGLPPGTAVIGFSPAKGDLIAYISPKRGGPLVTCQGTVRRCIVDAIIGNSDATEIWIGATHSSIPKRSAGALAGLSSRREIPLDDGDEKDGERTRKSNTPM